MSLTLVPKKKIDISREFLLNRRNFVSSSPCIIKDPDNENQYIILLRCNYLLMKGKYGTKTNNLLLYVDKSFNVIDQKHIHYNFDEGEFREGVEDVKLYLFNNKIYYIGTYKTNPYDKVSSDIFEYRPPPVELKENTIHLSFPTNFTHEKNWVFFNYRSTLRVIYRWYPLQICEIDYSENKLNLLEEKIMPKEFKDARGSSCGIEYDGLLWFVVHYQKTHRNTNRKYLHMFVVFDLDMNLIKYSECFTLETDREFSYGLLIENDEFILCYSTNNSTSNIVVYDYSYIQNGIKWIKNTIV